MFISNRRYDRLNARNVELAREVRELNGENRAVYEENKDLRFENEEIIELLTEIADRAFCCPLDSEKIVLDKIKELVRDYQSEN